MDQLPRRSLRSAEAALKLTQEAAAAPSTGDEAAPATSPPDGSLGRKKRTAEAAAKPPGDGLSSKTRIKSELTPKMSRGSLTFTAPLHPAAEARLALNNSMTLAGQRVDLSEHALGRLLVESPAVLDMLSTRDARHLRRADKALRTIVAEHPWSDDVSAVRSHVADWRSSFPSATACLLDSASLPKTVVCTLAGLSSFCMLKSLSSKSDPEFPLSVVRGMKRLKRLQIYPMVGSCPIPRDAPVWLELGGLLELDLIVPRKSLIPSLLGNVRCANLLSLPSALPK